MSILMFNRTLLQLVKAISSCGVMLLAVSGCSSGGGNDSPNLAEVDIVSAPSKITYGPRNDEDPSLVQRHDGTFLLAWFTENDGPGDVWLQSSENGQDWALASAISVEKSAEFYPSILEAADGSLHAAWFERDDQQGDLKIKYRYSSDLPDWSTAELVADGSGIDWAPALIEHDGAVWLFWSSTRSGNKEIMAAKRESSGWSSPHQVTDSSADDDFPFVLRMTDGNFLLVWTRLSTGGSFVTDEESEIYYAVSRDLVNWGEPVRFTDDGDARFIDVLPTAYNTKKGVHIAWTSNRNDTYGDIVDAPLADPKNQVLLTNSPGEDYSPKIVATSNPELFLMAWVSDRDGDSSNRDIYVQQFRLP